MKCDVSRIFFVAKTKNLAGGTWQGTFCQKIEVDFFSKIPPVGFGAIWQKHTILSL